MLDRRWRLGACIVSMMAIANLQYAWTFFTVPLTKSLNATLSAVQLAFTLFILAETWLVPVEGYLIDRFGARLMVTAGGVLVALGWVGSGMTNSLAGLYFWYTVGGVGAGAVYGASIGLALKWFPDRRGLAAGLTAGAYGFGAALTVLPIQSQIESGGYREAFLTWGIIQGLIVLAAARLMVAPAAGWRPVGWEPASGRVGQSRVSYTPLQMVSTGAFWTLYSMMTMVAFGGLMVTAQLKPIAATYGMDRTVLLAGITALSLAAILDRILNGLARPFWGWVSDQIGRGTTMAIAFSIEAIAKMALLALVDHPIWFVILTAFAFFAWGEIFSLFPATIGDVFGPDHATTNYGIQYTAKGTASIFAAWGAAKLQEATGSWAPVFYAGIVCDLAAAALAWFWLRSLMTRRMQSQSAGATGS